MKKQTLQREKKMLLGESSGPITATIAFMRQPTACCRSTKPLSSDRRISIARPSVVCNNKTYIVKSDDCETNSNPIVLNPKDSFNTKTAVLLNSSKCRIPKQNTMYTNGSSRTLNITPEVNRHYQEESAFICPFLVYLLNQ